MVTVVPIDDPSDPRISDYVDLNDRDLRRLRASPGANAGDWFIAEGALVVRQLLASPYPIRSLLVTPRGLRALEADLARCAAPVYLAPQPLVEAIAGYKFHRGALAAADRAPLPEMLQVAEEAALLVVVEGVNDHENLGALFRTPLPSAPAESSSTTRAPIRSTGGRCECPWATCCASLTLACPTGPRASRGCRQPGTRCWP